LGRKKPDRQHRRSLVLHALMNFAFFLSSTSYADKGCWFYFLPQRRLLIFDQS
jgi:hypothetical protein